MLVLSRKPGELIVVPQHGISFQVLEINGNSVRLGVTAPADVGVYREELWQRVREEAAPVNSAARVSGTVPKLAPARGPNEMHRNGATPKQRCRDKAVRDEERVQATLETLLLTGDRPLVGACGPVAEEEIEAAERELGGRLPRSYRAFLRRYGGGALQRYEIFGICRNGLVRDVVLMNQRAVPAVPSRYLRFARDVGAFDYYLDTARRGPDQECPVVVLGSGVVECTVADNFLDFLRRVIGGRRWRHEDPSDRRTKGQQA